MEAQTTAQPGAGLLHAFLLDGHGGGEVLDWNGVERWKPDDGVLWVNLDYAAPDAEAWLGMRSGLDPIVRDALLEPDPRPRALAQEERLLLVARGINLNVGAQPEDMVSLRCWFEPRRIITMRHRSVHALRGIVTDLTRGKGPTGPGDFLGQIIERVLEPVVSCVDRLDDEVALAEDEVLSGEAKEMRKRLADLRRRAISIRRFIAPQREALGKLPALAVPWLDERHRARLREAGDRLTRTVEELDAARDRAAVTHEELASRVGELTNQRLYVLSLITAVFLPLGFVCSLLGVNVGGVPARDVPWAFWVLLGLLSSGVAIQLWLFKRRNWL